VDVIIGLLLILVVAKALGELCERLGISSMIGEILAGVILGPSLLGFVDFDSTMSIFADLGIIALLFMSGAEMRMDRLAGSALPSVSTALGGMLVPFSLGCLVGLMFGLSLIQLLFLGAILSVTSIGISVRTLIDLKKLNTKVGYTIVEAAIFDDLIGIVLLAVLSSLALEQDQSLLQNLIPLVVGIAILLVLISVGRKRLEHLYEKARKARSHEMPYVLAIIIGIGLASFTQLVGLHFAIGAFVAGLIIGPQIRKEINLLESLGDLAFGFLATFFFASVGLLIAISSDNLFSWMIPIIIILGLFGKIAGGYFGSRHFMKSKGGSLLVGIGLCPRGEIALIISSIAFINGIIGEGLLTAVTILVITSVIFTPVAMRLGFRRFDPESG
jgi:Kef-type K+ transport system membrane component KefB